MRKRWQVVVIGKDWDYRTVDRKFVTKFAARRYAEAMNALPSPVVPLRLVVERIA